MKFLMGLLFVVSAHASASVVYSSQFDASKTSKEFNLKSVEYKLVPTKTLVRPIPGCRPSNYRTDCTETVVLETQPVIAVHVGHFDSSLVDGDYRGTTTTLNFRLEEFSAEDVTELKNLTFWRRIFSQKGQQIANDNLYLEVEKVERQVMVVDMERSKLCPIDRNRYPERRPGCEEILVYKPSSVVVNSVTVLKK